MEPPTRTGQNRPSLKEVWQSLSEIEKRTIKAERHIEARSFMAAYRAYQKTENPEYIDMMIDNIKILRMRLEGRL